MKTENPIFEHRALYTGISRFMQIVLSLALLFVGGGIYIAYRDESLLMFRWFEILGISDYVLSIRELVKSDGIYGWVKYNLPDGLWVFSYMYIIDAIWNTTKPKMYYMFVYCLPVVAICSEFMQFVGLCPGCFDMLDMVSYALAIFLFLFIKSLK